MNWERLEEAPVRSFSGIPVEVGGIEPEWAVFKASIAEAAAASCGLRVLGSSRGGNPRTPWWTPVVREAVRLKKEAFRDMISLRTPDSAAGYRKARRAEAAAVSEAEGFLSLVYWPNLRRNRCHKQKYYRPLLHGSSQCRGTLHSLV